MEYGSSGRKIKKIRRTVYKLQGKDLYYFKLHKGKTSNTSKKGITNGITVSKFDYRKIR